MVVCPKCNRFVREVTCPFCGAAVDQTSTETSPRVHATRVARAFGTVAVSASVAITACSSEDVPVFRARADEIDSSAPAYGTDAGTVPFDSGNVPDLDSGIPVYGSDAGSVPVDAGEGDAGGGGSSDGGSDQ